MVKDKMKYIMLFIFAVAITITGYIKFESLGNLAGSMVVAGALAVSLYAGIEILKL
jgi:hypothetical protein